MVHDGYGKEMQSSDYSSHITMKSSSSSNKLLTPGLKACDRLREKGRTVPQITAGRASLFLKIHRRKAGAVFALMTGGRRRQTSDRAALLRHEERSGS